MGFVLRPEQFVGVEIMFQQNQMIAAVIQLANHGKFDFERFGGGFPRQPVLLNVRHAEKFSCVLAQKQR